MGCREQHGVERVGRHQLIRDTISSVFNAAKDTVSSVWNSIKSAIETPIQNARDTVRNVIDSIKGFFNFSWSLPHLKLPHLSLSGSFSLAPPSVPHFGIDWYAKGGVFNGPSVIGVGEAGPEGVVPFNERGARPLAEGIAKLLDGKGGAAHGDTNVTINLYATVREEADIEKISRQIAKEIKRQECFAGYTTASTSRRGSTPGS